MESNMALILIDVTFHAPESIVGNDHVLAYFDHGHKHINITDQEHIFGDHYRVLDGMFSVNVVADVVNNVGFSHENEPPSEFLIDSYSLKYQHCNLDKLIKHVHDKFDRGILNRYGKETRRFLCEFELWSYYDSYCGDGDAGINYVKLRDI